MKNLERTILNILITLSICIFANGQSIDDFSKSSDAVKNNSQWTQIQTEDGKLKLSIPDNFTFFLDEDGFNLSKDRYSSANISFRNLRSVTASANGVVMWLESYDVKDGKEAFVPYLSFYSDKSPDVSDYKLGEYKLRRVKVDKEHYAEYIYFYSDKRVYFLGVASRDKNNSTISAFLQSIVFNGENLFNSPVTHNIDVKGKVFLEQIATTPLEVITLEDYEKEKKRKEKEIAGKQIPADKHIQDDNMPTAKVPDKSNKKSLIVLTKPIPGYTDKARQRNEQGTILMQLLFGRDGQIKQIKIVKSLEFGLVEKTVKVARRIRFLPQETDGKLQEVVKTIQYNFTIY